MIINFYVIRGIMHSFWLVLTHDLLEDRRVNLFPSVFFWNCGKLWIFRGHFTRLGEQRVEKRLPEAVDKFQKQEGKKKTCFFVENDLTRAVSVEHHWTRHKMFLDVYNK